MSARLEVERPQEAASRYSKNSMWRAALLAVMLIPTTASAQALSQVAGLFNIMAGIMLVVSILLFFGGLGMWFTRLGTWPTYRDEAIKMMAWGTSVLFVLAVLLALVQFIQNNLALASFIVGLVFIGLIVWFVLTVSASKKDDEHAH